MIQQCFFLSEAQLELDGKIGIPDLSFTKDLFSEIIAEKGQS